MYIEKQVVFHLHQFIWLVVFFFTAGFPAFSFFNTCRRRHRKIRTAKAVTSHCPAKTEKSVKLFRVRNPESIHVIIFEKHFLNSAEEVVASHHPREIFLKSCSSGYFSTPFRKIFGHATKNRTTNFAVQF